MIKKLSPILLIILTVNFAKAQEVNLTWSPESKTELEYYSFVKGKGSDLVKLCFEKKSKTAIPVVTRYDKNLEEQTVHNLSVDRKGIKFNNFLSVKDRLFFYTNFYDKDSKATSFYCQQLDIKTFDALGENIDLGTFDSHNKNTQASAEFSFSKDSTKILMVSLSPYEANETEKYYMSVFDNKMVKIWDNTVELPYKDKYVDILSKIVTNEGKVGILLKHYESETTKENIRKDGKKAPSYVTKLLLYNKGESIPKEFIINTADKFIHTLKIADETEKDITLFGLYQTKPEGNVNGYFTVDINKNTNIVKVNNTTAFPSDLLEAIKNDKQGSDNERDPGLGYDFEFVKTLTRANGDKDYLLEYQKSYLFSGGSMNYTYSYMVYEYGDIIDINIKPNGKNIITRIPKHQMGAGFSLFHGFEAITYKNKLLLFYNDDNKNLEKDLSDKPEKLKFGKENATLALAKIDSEGEFTREILIDRKTSKYTTAINVSFAIDKNKIALYALKGGLFTTTKDMVGILELK